MLLARYLSPLYCKYIHGHKRLTNQVAITQPRNLEALAKENQAFVRAERLSHRCHWSGQSPFTSPLSTNQSSLHKQTKQNRRRCCHAVTFCHFSLPSVAPLIFSFRATSFLVPISTTVCCWPFADIGETRTCTLLNTYSRRIAL